MDGDREEGSEDEKDETPNQLLQSVQKQYSKAAAPTTVSAIPEDVAKAAALLAGKVGEVPAAVTKKVRDDDEKVIEVDFFVVFLYFFRIFSSFIFCDLFTSFLKFYSLELYKK